IQIEFGPAFWQSRHRGKMKHNVHIGCNSVQRIPAKIEFVEGKQMMRTCFCQVGFLDRSRVIGNERVNAHNRMAGVQQTLTQMRTDEPRGSRDQTLHEPPSLDDASLSCKTSDSRFSSRFSRSSIRPTACRTRLLKRLTAADKSVDGCAR